MHHTHIHSVSDRDQGHGIQDEEGAQLLQTLGRSKDCSHDFNTHLKAWLEVLVEDILDSYIKPGEI